MNYRLDEQGFPVIEPDGAVWGRWFGVADRVVALTQFGDIQVSTVFLGIDHRFGGDGPPILWETMVFAEEATLTRLMELSETDDRSIIAKVMGGVDIQKRYTSREEAEQGHNTMCVFIHTCLNADLLRPQQEWIEGEVS